MVCSGSVSVYLLRLRTACRDDVSAVSDSSHHISACPAGLRENSASRKAMDFRGGNCADRTGKLLLPVYSQPWSDCLRARKNWFPIWRKIRRESGRRTEVPADGYLLVFRRRDAECTFPASRTRHAAGERAHGGRPGSVRSRFTRPVDTRHGIPWQIHERRQHESRNCLLAVCDFH